MNATLPKRISERYLKQQRQLLASTRKTSNDGGPNPNYAALETEINDAQSELDRWDAFAAWMLANHSAKLNEYPLRTPGQTFDAGKVFMHKDKATNRVTHWTLDAAWELYQASL